jgi:hypothetical protein
MPVQTNKTRPSHRNNKAQGFASLVPNGTGVPKHDYNPRKDGNKQHQAKDNHRQNNNFTQPITRIPADYNQYRAHIRN